MACAAILRAPDILGETAVAGLSETKASSETNRKRPDGVRMYSEGLFRSLQPKTEFRYAFTRPALIASATLFGTTS